MIDRRNSWTNQITLGLLVLISISVLVLHFREGPTGPLHRLQRFSVNMLAPLQSGSFSVARGFSDAWASVTEFSRLKTDNRALAKEVSELKRDTITLKELDLENKRLRSEIGAPVRQQFATVFATVIGKSVNTWQATVILDKGSSDGVKQQMPVATADGLVGQVMSTTTNSCLVQLIMDQKSAVGVRLQSSRATGIVEGEGQNQLQLNYLPKDVKTVKNEVVLSSGLGGVYPPGLVVGTIESAGKNNDGLFQDVKVSPTVDFWTLEEVFIITGVRS
jgi:rod shape-determining protein MreC